MRRLSSALHCRNRHGHRHYPTGTGTVVLRSFSGNTNANIELDQVCELAASNLRFGPGATKEVGQDLALHFKCKRIAVFTDPTIKGLDCMQVLLKSLDDSKLDYFVYDKVRMEPNDTSFQHAIDFLSTQNYDAVVALGGGSVLDTAKAANLYACHPAESFYDYVNPPTGRGLPIPGPVKPLIAIPTTAGTGSETTGVCIFDDAATKSKTGIANRHLKPALGIVDPNNTATLPAAVATYSGLDVLCHAVESYTALPFNQRPKPDSPLGRPAYQGSNPISDVWALFALRTAAESLPAAVNVNLSGHDQARANMLLASSAAGMGFGNAGVHLCHGMSYPISSQITGYRGYNMENIGVAVEHDMVPHGHSVILAAPAVVRFTAVANPERHADCARILAQARTNGSFGNSNASSVGESPQAFARRNNTTSNNQEDAGTWLADEILELCHHLQVPMGLQTLGYTRDHIPALVEGTLPQHRVTKISPRPVGREELELLFLDAMEE
jgi:hydroxyacid-oxoacid transhydrogenase